MFKNSFSIEELFTRRIFVVPDYQRGFAWDEQNFNELMEDIEVLLPNQNHYTGTIILNPTGTETIDNLGSPNSINDVVDGQQRITCIVILLKIICDEFKEIGTYKELAKGIQHKYLFSKRELDDEPFFRLKLNHDSNEFFQNNILNHDGVRGPSIKSHERLQHAFEFFKSYFDKLKKDDSESYASTLKRIFDIITQKMKVVIYEVEDTSEVGVIFEVTNNRGKQLSELEKVKNYLMYLSSKLDQNNELKSLINETWTEIYSNFMTADLGSDSENQFLRAHWLAYEDYNRKEWEGSKSVKKLYNLRTHLQNKNILFTKIKKYVISLKNSSVIFADCEKPTRDLAFNVFGNVPIIRKILHQSIKLKNTRTLATFRPLLIACRLTHPNDGEKYLELITLLEIFAFRVYNLSGKRADTGAAAVFKIAHQLVRNRDKFPEYIKQIKAVCMRYSSAVDFDRDLSYNPKSNNWYQKPILKYLLYEYEEELANKSKGKVKYNWEVFSSKNLKETIEHILPQDMSDPYWQKHFTSKSHEEYLNDLGNLSLTLHNSVYSNKSFLNKKGKVGQNKHACYANSGLYQERELLEYRMWTRKSIIKRRNKILDWARHRWNIDFTNVSLIEDGEFLLNTEMEGGEDFLLDSTQSI